MICFLDMDGVLVDFHSAFLRAHGIGEEAYSGHEGSYCLHAITGLTDDNELWEPVDRDFWVNLDWTKEGREILRLVESAFGRENTFICTAGIDREGCHEGKIEWMRRNLPARYASRSGHVFAYHKELLSQPGRLLIDDRTEAVTNFNYHGGRAILVPRLWNTLYFDRDKAITHVRYYCEKFVEDRQR